MFDLVRKMVSLDLVLAAGFLALAILQGGQNLRVLGEVTGVQTCYRLADEADLIRDKVFAVIKGAEDEAVESASLSVRTGRILKEYKKEL